MTLVFLLVCGVMVLSLTPTLYLYRIAEASQPEEAVRKYKEAAEVYEVRIRSETRLILLVASFSTRLFTSTPRCSAFPS